MFRLSIDTSNAAFEDPGPEIARLLRFAATEIAHGADEGVLRDVNGNRCGSFRIEEDCNEP